MIRLKVRMGERGLLLRQMRIIFLCLIQGFENLVVGFRQKDLDMLTGPLDDLCFLREVILP